MVDSSAMAVGSVLNSNTWFGTIVAAINGIYKSAGIIGTTFHSVGRTRLKT